MADLDLDELERLLTEATVPLWMLANGSTREATAAAALERAAPALIAAARERDRLRALCREAHAALDGIVDVLTVEGCSCSCGHDQDGHDETCERCEMCRVDAHVSTRLLDRLRAAGGGT